MSQNNDTISIRESFQVLMVVSEPPSYSMAQAARVPPWARHHACACASPIGFSFPFSYIELTLHKESRSVRMDEEYQIVYVEKPEQSAWGTIGQGISNYNIQQVGDDNFQRLCFVLQAPDEAIVGGVIGELYWGWFHVDLLWVQDELRGRGYGHRLLTRAEDEARLQGAKNAYLDTFTFQAPDFYIQHGYQVFGELQDFPPGHQRCFLTKQL